MIAVYFTNFNLTIFNSDFCISDYESILKISDIGYKEDERKYIPKIIGYERSIDEIMQRPQKIRNLLKSEINIAINMYYISSRLYKFYSLGFNGIGFLGKLFILVFMLAFCYSFEGVISYIYVLYCFISIYRYPKAFKKRRNYKSKGITRIKIYLFVDI